MGRYPAGLVAKETGMKCPRILTLGGKAEICLECPFEYCVYDYHKRVWPNVARNRIIKDLAEHLTVKELAFKFNLKGRTVRRVLK